MKARAISKFIWRDKRYEVNDPVEVDEPKATAMVKEGLIEIVTESAAPEKSAPVEAAPVAPGNATVAPASANQETVTEKHVAKPKSKKKSGGKV